MERLIHLHRLSAQGLRKLIPNVTSNGNISSPSTDMQLPFRTSLRPTRPSERTICNAAQLAAPARRSHHLRPRWRAPNPTPFLVLPKQAAAAAAETAKCRVLTPDPMRGGFGSGWDVQAICAGDARKFCCGPLQQEACGCGETRRLRRGFQAWRSARPDAPLMAMCEWDLRVVQEAPFEPIRVGAKVPDGELSYLDDDGKLHCYGIHDLVREKRVVFFGVPGAFTPTCSLKHVPGFLQRAEEIMDRGVREIVCVTVNDPWVVKGWEKTYPDNKHVKFLCDGSATWTKKIGLELDLIDRGMGVRSRRYCLLVDDTIVKIANIEEAGGLETSTADRIMADLEASKGAAGGCGGC